MGLYDNLGSTGGYDYFSLMNNPYFLAAYQSYNPNFKASQASQTNASSAAQETSASNSATDGAIPVVTDTQEASGGMNFTTGALATAIIGTGAYLLLKKNPKGIVDKAKTFFRFGDKSASSITTNLKNLTAVKTPDGKIKFLIPGKTTTVRGGDVQRFVNQNGLQEAVSASRQKFNPEASHIDTFVFTSGADRYVVNAENGVITSIKDKKGNQILKRLQEAESGHADALRLEGLNNILKELGKSKDVDKSMLRGVTNIRYTNAFGDDVLQMTAKRYGETPQLRQYTTLQRYDFNDAEMQAYKLSSEEKVFADTKFFKDGKLVDGVKVSKFSDKIGGGYVGNFEGETLVSVTKPDGTVLPSGSAGYENIVSKYESNINKLKKKVFEKREYIPVGATVVRS